MILRNESNSQTVWLRPLTVLDLGLVIEVAFPATAREVKRSIRLQIECPNLVSACHRENQCVSIDCNDVLWR